MKIINNKDLITKEVRDSLLKSFELVSYNSGDLMFSQGDGETSLYIVMSGTVKLSTHYEGIESSVESTVVEYRYPEAVGSLSFLSGGPHKATARAKTNVSAIRITQEGFVGLKDSDPELSEEIMVMSIRSLQVMVDCLLVRYQEREIMLKGPRK